MKDFVYIDDFELFGNNFYFRKGEKLGLSNDELKAVNLVNDRVMVHKDLIEPLKRVNEEFFKKLGYQLYISEGYRSKKLYELLNKKMIERLGESGKEKILNTIEMPHSTGKSVDVALYSDGEVVRLHNKEDGIDGYFIDFYKGKNDFYQDTQQKIIKIMIDNGFELGEKGEYFHYNYVAKRPQHRSIAPAN